MSDTAAPQGRESLIVQSKVRDVIRNRKDAEGKELGLRVSEEFLTALSEEVYASIDGAIERCLGNRRKTLDKFDV